MVIKVLQNLVKIKLSEISQLSISIKQLYLNSNLYMISFDNTENAFKAKSNSDLNRSYWLFKIIGNPALVKFGAKTAPIGLALGSAFAANLDGSSTPFAIARYVLPASKVTVNVVSVSAYDVLVPGATPITIGVPAGKSTNGEAVRNAKLLRAPTACPFK